MARCSDKSDYWNTEQKSQYWTWWHSLAVFTLETHNRLDGFGQTFDLRLDLRLQYKDRNMKHYASGRSISGNASWTTHNERNFVQAHNASMCLKTGNRWRKLKTETVLQTRQRLYAQNVLRSVSRPCLETPSPFSWNEASSQFLPPVSVSQLIGTSLVSVAFLKSQLKPQELQFRTSSPSDGVSLHITFISYYGKTILQVPTRLSRILPPTWALITIPFDLAERNFLDVCRLVIRPVFTLAV